MTSLKPFLSILIYLAIMLAAPGILASVSGEASLAMILVAAFLYLLCPRSKVLFESDRMWLAVLQLIFILYLLLQAFMLDTLASNRSRNYLFVSIITLCIGALYGASMSSVQELRLFARTHVWLMAILSVSACITVIVTPLIGLERLELIHFSLLNHSVSATKFVHGATVVLYAPMTLTTGVSRVAGLEFPRSIGLFREPGLFGFALLMGYVLIAYTGFTPRAQYVLRAILLGGLVTTFSTAAMLTFVGLEAYRSLARKTTVGRVTRAILGCLAVGVFAWAMVRADVDRKVIGYYDTEDSRFSSIRDSAVLLTERPWLGFGATSLALERLNEGINFLSALHFLGGIGIMIYVSVVIAAWRANHGWRHASIMVVTVATLALSQPIYYMAITFLIFNLPMKEFSTVQERRVLYVPVRPRASGLRRRVLVG